MLLCLHGKSKLYTSDRAPWTYINTHAEGKTLCNHTCQRDTSTSCGTLGQSSTNEELQYYNTGSLFQIIYKSRTRSYPGRNWSKATNVMFALKQQAKSSYLQLNYTKSQMKKIYLRWVQKQSQFPFYQNIESEYLISCGEPHQAALWGQDQSEVINSRKHGFKMIKITFITQI